MSSVAPAAGLQKCISEPCHEDILVKACENESFSTRSRAGLLKKRHLQKNSFELPDRETVDEPETQSEEEPGQEARGLVWRGQAPQ